MLDYATLKYRYTRNYITDEQLDRCVVLQIITEEQAASIRESK